MCGGSKKFPLVRANQIYTWLASAFPLGSPSAKQDRGIPRVFFFRATLSSYLEPENHQINTLDSFKLSVETPPPSIENPIAQLIQISVYNRFSVLASRIQIWVATRHKHHGSHDGKKTSSERHNEYRAATRWCKIFSAPRLPP